MKNVNNFQIANVQSRDATSHLFDFLPIFVWRCFKIVAYKKSMQLAKFHLILEVKLRLHIAFMLKRVQTFLLLYDY